jgi:hypothetical protein
MAAYRLRRAIQNKNLLLDEQLIHSDFICINLISTVCGNNQGFSREQHMEIAEVFRF